MNQETLEGLRRYAESIHANHWDRHVVIADQVIMGSRVLVTNVLELTEDPGLTAHLRHLLSELAEVCYLAHRIALNPTREAALAEWRKIRECSQARPGAEPASSDLDDPPHAPEEAGLTPLVDYWARRCVCGHPPELHQIGPALFFVGCTKCDKRTPMTEFHGVAIRWWQDQKLLQPES